eukprot:1633522-Rhodomonas_salina.2
MVLESCRLCAETRRRDPHEAGSWRQSSGHGPDAWAVRCGVRAQKVDVTSGSQPVRGRSFRSFPVAPYGGWQRQDRPSTARYTSRAPGQR